MEKKSVSNYDIEYFDRYQKKIGELGGVLNKFKFQKHILKSDSVLDFGCGGGFLLHNLECDTKVGVELNDIARNFCNQNFNFKCYKFLNEIPDDSINVVISNHCLEHTPNPDQLIEELYNKIRKGYFNKEIIKNKYKDLIIGLLKYNSKDRYKYDNVINFFDSNIQIKKKM